MNRRYRTYLGPWHLWPLTLIETLIALAVLLLLTVVT